MIQVVEEGKRKAKGTTGEVGLVSSYFANPFGPVQEKAKTHQLVLQDFKALAAQGTKLGVIYTKLAIPGHDLYPNEPISPQFLFQLHRGADLVFAFYHF